MRQSYRTLTSDPYKVFLHSRITSDDGNKSIKVATESNTLCAILPLVTDQEQVKAILNPGYQIVNMSEEVCLTLAVPYDLNIHLNMVSVNGGVDQSLRLVKNMPFKIGNITVYLQVHILWQPTYDILLG